MPSLWLHPALPFALAAALVPWVAISARRLLALAAPLAALLLLVGWPEEARPTVDLLGHLWMPVRADRLGRLFALAFIGYAFIAGLYAWSDSHPGSRCASLGLAGAGVGVVLAGDLLSLFFFWEWLTITSLFLIWFGGRPDAWAAGFRYLMFHLAGAMMLLSGILMHVAEGGGEFVALPVDRLSGWLVLGGMLTNAAVPPLHAWLSDAYPRASVYGTVFLSAFTTKAAVYALARGFPGLELLVWAGAAMALFGVIYAVLENDIRRLLGYHIISQVGYMVAGVGLGTALAIDGTAAHAFSHIFYKGLLMMSAGAVIHATGCGRLTELGHLARALRWPLVFMMIGAFSISGVPFFNGFVSKSMIVSAAAYADRGAIELMLLVASMGTFLHTGLKLPWFTFFGRDQGARVRRPVPRSMMAAMTLAALVCLGTGVLPETTLYALLPHGAEYHPFTPDHFVQMLQLLLGTALGFWLLRAKLGGEPTVTRDVDALYRAPLAWLVGQSSARASEHGARLQAALLHLIARTAGGAQARRAASRPAAIAWQATIVLVVFAAAAGIALLLPR